MVLLSGACHGVARRAKPGRFQVDSAGVCPQTRTPFITSLPDAMKLRIVLAAVVLALAATPGSAQPDKPLRVFILASEKTHGPGEHDYPRFLQDWTRLLNERGALATGAQRFPTREELERTDVLLLYAADGNNIAEPDRKNLERF